MIPTQLVEYFDRISEASDAIPRLRRFVLDLAIRGRLVEQAPQDEPASELLRRIQAAKIKLGRVERPKKETATSTDGQKFSLPAGWVWASLADLVTVLNGRAYSQNELLNEGTPVLRVGNLFTSHHWYYSNLELSEDKYCDEGDLIFSWSASFGPFIWRGPKVIYHYHIWKLALHSERDLNKLYLYRLLSQKTQEIKNSGHGISMLHMTKEKMEKLQVPLPPLAEQHRIVDKVDELMSLCDRLEVTRVEREKRRDQLIAVSLHHLNNGAGSKLFREEAHFCIANVPALINRPAHVQQFRQTVLNLAVRGRLVEQYSTDEPASELLKRLRADKDRLLEERKIKRHKELPPIEEEDAPFSIPPGWQWERFIEIAAIQSNLVSPSKYEDSPHIAPDNIESGTGRLLPYTTVRDSAVFSAKHLFFGGCILYSKIRPALAKAVIVDFDGLCSADMYPILPFIRREYLHKYMLSEAFVRQSISEDNRVAMPKINQIALAKIAVPVPPLAEQDRIVAKVNELMELCDRLEGQLTAAHSETHHLLESVLHHALRSSDQVREDGKR
jgi:type I restriction enzyme S subunit